MVKIKEGVSLRGYNAMAIAHSVIIEVHRNYGYDTIITSGSDGRHMVGSRHHSANALDYRVRHLGRGVKQQLWADVQKALGPEFNVVVKKSCAHVEYDPK